MPNKTTEEQIVEKDPSVGLLFKKIQGRVTKLAGLPVINMEALANEAHELMDDVVLLFNKLDAIRKELS